jgi:outer membrane protein OmpA-like peptidoglycan-associated protein/Tol biopolymer transport system component
MLFLPANKNIMQRILNTRQIIIGAAVASCLLLNTTLQAQFSYDYLKAADNYFSKADYASSAAYYEKYLKGGKGSQEEYDPYTAKATKKAVVPVSRQKAVYQLAESYRLLKDYAKAAPLYQQLSENNTAQYPLVNYQYATCLRALGKYAAAEKALTDFLTTYTAKDNYSEQARREAGNLRFIQEQLQKKEVALYSVHAISAGKEGASYAPVRMNSNTLLFTATWPDSSAPANKTHTNRLYQATYEQGALAGIARASLPANPLHEGAAAVSADGNTLYLTKWAVSNGRKTAAIYVSKKAENGSWSNPAALDTMINRSGYSAQQPFIMPDGKHLLYASDREGGFGGFDLWRAELDATGKPVAVVNLGNTINSTSNEQAPYFHTGSSTLVFASDGRTGMGGYDLFYSKDNAGSWKQPENFGYPVNSVKDDMYFTSYGTGNNILENVVLSSDRSAVCCLELFGLQKKNPLRKITGQVIACDTKTPLPGVLVLVVNPENGKRVFSGITNQEGKYTFTIEQYLPLNGTASFEGYVTTTRPLRTPADATADSIVDVPVCLVKEVPVIEEVQVLNNVYYEFGKAEILETSYPALDKVAALLNSRPGIKVEIGGHTDDKGAASLNLKLSEQRAANVVAYLVSKGVEKNRLTAKGYGATMPIAPNKNEDGSDNPEGREKNRRTEMKVLENK